jgi:hypothetical protein
MLIYRSGDLLADDATWRAIPVNCVGVAGAGLARDWAAIAPQSLSMYQTVCRRQKLAPGELGWLNGSDGNWLLVATKLHWKAPSRLEWVNSACRELRGRLLTDDTLHLATFALPALGCGFGGLRWPDVTLIFEQFLGDLPQEIRIYEPRVL